MSARDPDSRRIAAARNLLIARTTDALAATDPRAFATAWGLSIAEADALIGAERKGRGI